LLPQLLLVLLLGAAATSPIALGFQPPPPAPPPPSPPPHVIEALVGYASNKGLQMVAPPSPGGTTITSSTSTSSDSSPLRYVHLPVSLLPASFPRAAFQQVTQAAPVFNALVDRISRDADWLEASLAEAAQSDDFTGRLLGMYTALRGQGPPAQRVALGLHRSDYMVDDDQERERKEEGPRLVQVELNTIASSFGCLAAGTAGLHRFLLERYFVADGAEEREAALAFLSGYLRAHPGVAKPATADDAAQQCLAALPPNPTLEALPAAIAAAHAHYGRAKAVVVFVVQPGERNLFDQRFLELALWERHKVPVVRLTLEQVCDLGWSGFGGGRLVRFFSIARCWPLVLLSERQTDPTDHPHPSLPTAHTHCKHTHALTPPPPPPPPPPPDPRPLPPAAPGARRPAPRRHAGGLGGLFPRGLHPRGLPQRKSVGGAAHGGALCGGQVPDAGLPAGGDQEGVCVWGGGDVWVSASNNHRPLWQGLTYVSNMGHE
jgi:hypothetical protein